MSRKARPASRATQQVARVEQVELFPDPVHVDRLDPRTVAGSATSATAVFRVTIGHGGEHHMVFQDRYGTYCELHGRTCPAVAAVQAQ